MEKSSLAGGDERLITALLWRLFAEFAAGQFFTVGEHDFADHADGSAFLAGGDGEGDDVTGFQEPRIPTRSLEHRRGQSFDAPIHRLPGLIFNVEENLAMRIGPIIFGDGAFEGLEIFCVVLGAAVVGPERRAKDERADKQAEVQRQPSSHPIPK